MPAGRDRARPLQENGSRPAHGGVRSPRPTDASQVVPSNGPPGSSCPTGDCGEPPRLPWVAAHSGASAARMGGIGGNRGRDHPQRGQQPRTIPQSALRLPAPFTQGSLALRGKGGWDGDADCRNQRPKFWSKIWLAVATPQARRPCGPPRNDNGFLSFRGAERRGNPSFYDGRGTGRRGRRPLRKVYRSPSNGPM